MTKTLSWISTTSKNLKKNNFSNRYTYTLHTHYKEKKQRKEKENALTELSQLYVKLYSKRGYNINNDFYLKVTKTGSI